MRLNHDLGSEEMSPPLKADIMKHIPENIPGVYVMASSVSGTTDNR